MAVHIYGIYNFATVLPSTLESSARMLDFGLVEDSRSAATTASQCMSRLQVHFWHFSIISLRKNTERLASGASPFPQYFTLPLTFLLEWLDSTGMWPESTGMRPESAGMQLFLQILVSFLWIPVTFWRIPVETVIPEYYFIKTIIIYILNCLYLLHLFKYINNGPDASSGPSCTLLFSVLKSGPVQFFALQGLRPRLRPVHIFQRRKKTGPRPQKTKDHGLLRF